MEFNWDEPYEEIVGFGFSNFKYIQNGMYFNAKGVRVKETGEFWTERDEQKIQEVKDLVEKAKEDPSIAGAAKAAESGVALPKRIMARGKK